MSIKIALKFFAKCISMKQKMSLLLARVMSEAAKEDAGKNFRSHYYEKVIKGLISRSLCYLWP